MEIETKVPVFLRLIRLELALLTLNPEYDGSDEQVENMNQIVHVCLHFFNWDFENDDNAVTYFSKATSQEILEYYLTFIDVIIKGN